MLSNFLVKTMQNFIRARYIRIYSLVGTFYRDVQVQVAEKQRLIVKRSSNRQVTIVMQCNDSEVVKIHFHAMYVIKVSLVALI
jgi:hypothetical protein